MLSLTCHGGMCCGIKHIHGFPHYPLYGKEPPLYEKNDDDEYFFGDQDANGDTVSSAMNVFNEYVPGEPLWNRFDRYLRWIEKNRPGGIVEVTLSKSCQDFSWDQIELHKENLLKRGFKLINSARNSNSNNIFNVYHKNMTYFYEEEN